MMDNISNMLKSVREEEERRLPYISQLLSSFIQDLENLKIKSVLVTNEMISFNDNISMLQSNIKSAVNETTLLNEVCIENIIRNILNKLV